MPCATRQNRNAEDDLRGEKYSNATHATDPEVWPYKNSRDTGAMLCFIAHALIENRRYLIVLGDLTEADGYTGRRAMFDFSCPGKPTDSAFSKAFSSRVRGSP